MDVNTSNNDENVEITTPTMKGMKRNAASPPDSEVKKVKIVNEEERESSLEIIEETMGTPKTAARTPKTPKTTREEREKLRLQKLEEREKQRAEKERALEEKRLEKEKQLVEKRMEKEKKERERLEKKAEEDRKKEEKRKEAEEKKKEAEEKMKRKKEEEEKKKREEEEKKEQKRKEEEALEEKKRRDAARFKGFFSKVEKKKVVSSEQNNDNNWYRPFQIKDGMKLAPILYRNPVTVDANELLHCKPEVTSSTYLTSNNVKNRTMQPPKRTQACYKLLQFHDNHRPPYYGTFRKKPQKLTGKNTCSPIEPGIDYEVDSDEEWEDEPSDGEECRSDDEEEGDDDAMSDDGFFVPPCYLSDGEGEEERKEQQDGGEKEEEEAEEKVGGGEDEEEHGEENADERKARLASRAKEWSRRVTRGGHISLESRCIGPCYYDVNGSCGIKSAAVSELTSMMAVQFF